MSLINSAAASFQINKHCPPGGHLAAHEAVGGAHGAVPRRKHDEGKLAPLPTVDWAVLNNCKIE